MMVDWKTAMKMSWRISGGKRRSGAGLIEWADMVKAGFLGNAPFESVQNKGVL